MGVAPSTVGTLTGCNCFFSRSPGNYYLERVIVVFGNYSISLPRNMSISIIGNKRSVCITEHTTTVSAMMFTCLFCHALGIPSISGNQKIGDSGNGSLGDWINLQTLSWIVKLQTVSCLSSTSSWKNVIFCSFTGILLPIGISLASSLWWYSQPEILSELL